MTCLHCTAALVRDPVDKDRHEILGAFARAGFVNCGNSELRGTFKPFRSTCKNFASVDAATVEKRERWAQGLQR